MAPDSPGSAAQLEALLAAITALQKQVAVLDARVELLDHWNTGLLRFVLLHEFRFWQQVGQFQQRTNPGLTDEARDEAAAKLACDNVMKTVPDAARATFESGRDGFIDMLLDAAGHEPKLN